MCIVKSGGENMKLYFSDRATFWAVLESNMDRVFLCLFILMLALAWAV